MASLRVEESSDIEPHIRRKNVPNPQDAYDEIISILIDDCNISKSDINEEMYEHEKRGEVEVVHSKIEAVKKFDKFSKDVVKIEMDIEMKPVRGEEYDYVGDLEIEIEGKVRTDYPQDNAVQKSMLWHAFRTFYEKVLYGDIKKVYMKKCDKYMRQLRDGLKSYFDMLPTVS
ncbi:MAG: hypothetical protein ACLFS3_02070 [Candidatus Aenigmatarchaeota archaeon]